MNVTVRSARTAQPSTCAGVGLQARRNVDGDDRAARRVDRARCSLGRSAGDVARESRAEDRIDDDVRVAAHLRMPGLELPARRDELVVRAARVAAAGRGSASGNDVHSETLRARDAGDHVAVAAVVAAARRARTIERAAGPAPAQRVERRVPGARHQFVAGNAEALDGATVELAHLRRRCRARQGAGACRHYTARPSPDPPSMQPPLQPAELARASIKRLGPRTRLPEGRHCRHRPGRRRAAAGGVAGARASRRRWATWQRHGTRRTRPAELVPGTIRVISARMDYWPDDARDPDSRARTTRRWATSSRYALGRDYHKVLRTRLAQLADRIAAAVGRRGLPRVHRQRARAGESAGARRRPRLDRQAHQPDRPARRLLVLPRRDLHRPAAAGRRAGEIALRQLHGLHRRLPDAGHRRALRARCAPLHLLPDDRARRVRSRRSSAPRSATASTAATTASWCAPGTGMRKVTAEPDFRAAARPRRAKPGRRCSAGARSSFSTRDGRQRDSTHRLRALAAQRRGGARQCAADAGGRRCTRIARATTRASWCASTCAGHCAPAKGLGDQRYGQSLASLAFLSLPGLRPFRSSTPSRSGALDVVDQPRPAEPASREHDEVHVVGRRACEPIRGADFEVVRPEARIARARRSPSASHAGEVRVARFEPARARSSARYMRRRDRALARRSGSGCANSARARPPRAPSARRRSSPAGCRSSTTRRITVSCWKSFSPKIATSGCTRHSSFTTTVATPWKCPGRNTPHRMSVRPGTSTTVLPTLPAGIHLVDRRVNERIDAVFAQQVAHRRPGVRGYARNPRTGPNCSRVDEDAGDDAPAVQVRRADIRLTWPMCRLPMVGTNAMLSRASRQRVTVSRSSAIRVIVCIGRAVPGGSVLACSETVLGRRVCPRS